MKRFLALWALFALVAAIAIASRTVSESTRDAEDLRRRIKLAQERFQYIAIAYEHIIIERGLQNYPPPDFEVRSQGSAAMNMAYGRLSTLMGGPHADPARIERVTNERRSLHFDWLALIDDSPMERGLRGTLRENIPDEALRGFHQYHLFADPFAPNLQLGYISTFTDYWLISVGPNRNPDILGFQQWRDGRYRERGGSDNLSNEQVAELAAEARARFNDTPYKSDNTLRLVSPDLIYDPTNGAFSDGDIVFHRRRGDDWLFSYPGSYTLTPENLIPRDIEELFP